MIQLDLDSRGELRAIQTDLSPSVYLDHWALRSISADRSLSEALVSGLRRRHGTLLVSWLHVAEFSAVGDASQAAAAETFVDQLLPHVYFVDVNPISVIERENQLLRGELWVAPHADPQFLNSFMHLKPHGPQPFTAIGMFSSVQGRRDPSGLNSLADTVVERLESMRVEVHSNAAVRRNVLRLPKGAVVQRGTRLLFRELARTFLLDRQLRITRNHAIDLLHAVVPSAYADYVLLDKHWETQLQRAKTRLSMARLSVPVASVFSGKRNGLDDFLAAFAAG